MALMYFNRDGSYGELTDAIRKDKNVIWNMAVPVRSWTADMLELIQGWADEHRYELAKHFNVGVHELDKNGVCPECTLDAERLAGQTIKQYKSTYVPVIVTPVVEGDVWV